MVEAAVVGEKIFLEELGSCEVDFLRGELEVRKDAGGAVEAFSLTVRGEAEEEVDELCSVAQIGEEAVFEQAKGDPGKGLFDGSEAVGSKDVFSIVHGLLLLAWRFVEGEGAGFSSSGILRGGPSILMVLQ